MSTARKLQKHWPNRGRYVAQEFYGVAPDASWQAVVPAAGHMSFLRATSVIDWALRRLCPGCSPEARCHPLPLSPLPPGGLQGYLGCSNRPFRVEGG